MSLGTLPWRGEGGVDEDYWNSPQGWRHRWRDLQPGDLWVLIDSEPLAKGPRGTQGAHEIREAIAKALNEQGVTVAPRRGVALDLHINTTRRNPPKVQRFPKYYLDLLGRSDPPIQGRDRLLFEDDKQVAFLSVTCRHNWDPTVAGEPRVFIHSRDAASVMHDLRLADQLDRHPDFMDLDEDTYTDTFETDWMSIQRLRHSGEEFASRLADLMEYEARSRFQSDVLRSNDRVLANLLIREADKIILGKDHSAEEQRIMRLAGPNGEPPAIWKEVGLPLDRQATLRFLPAINLPPLPREEGESDEFLRGVSNACQEYLNLWPWLSPLVVPLRLTLLVLPPDGTEKTTTDLDNLMTSIIGVVDIDLRPPAEPWHLRPRLGDDEQDVARRDAAAKRLRSLHEVSIWGYQAIRLARRPDDPPEGQVLLILGHGEEHSSVWREASRFIEDAFDRWDD